MQGDEERLNLQSQTDQVDTSLTTNKTLLRCSLQQTRDSLSRFSPNSAADSEAKDGEEADGRGGGGDRASGTR